ncbi:MAG: SpoIIE family protein phosphatase [Acidobacteriota bacterium]
MATDPASPSSAASHRDSVATDPSIWADLLEPSRRQRDDRQVIARMLHGWAATHGVDAAGLYVRGAVAGAEPELGLLATTGPLDDTSIETVALPETLDERTDGEPQGALRHLALPGAMLVASGSGTLDSTDPTLLLLAAAGRIAVLKKEVQTHSFQAMFRGVELEVLYEVGLVIASTLDLEALGIEVLARAVSLLDARRGALYLSEDGAAADQGEFHLVSSLGGDARDEIDLGGIDMEALEAGLGDGGAGLLPGSKHLLGARIDAEGATRGLLVVSDKERRTGVGPFASDDRRTLALFASQAAIALENARLHRYALETERLEREMELASEIQRQLLPDSMPSMTGYEILGWNRSARHVGGDYFGFHRLDDGRWSLVVGDVSGKGVPAALLVSTLHSALSVLLELSDVGAQLVERLNRHVCDSSSANKFITMILAVLEPSTGRLTYLNAGHNPGLVLRQAGGIDHLPAGGMPIGLMPTARYEGSALELEAGDLLCLYSDGITECAARDDEEYGLERLEALLTRLRDEPLDAILTRIDEAMLTFADGQQQGDDQTVVLVRRTSDD